MNLLLIGCAVTGAFLSTKTSNRLLIERCRQGVSLISGFKTVSLRWEARTDESAPGRDGEELPTGVSYVRRDDRYVANFQIPSTRKKARGP